MSDLFDRVRFTREAFEVERCHTHPHALRYSVGHHSAGVAALVIQTWLHQYKELPRAELITEALYHDAPELVTGDIPSPTKTMLGGALDELEKNVLRWLLPWPGYATVVGLGALNETERDWLNCADATELFLWCMEEVKQRGNRVFVPWIDYYRNKWNTNPMPEPFMNLVQGATRSMGSRGEYNNRFQGESEK